MSFEMASKDTYDKKGTYTEVQDYENTFKMENHEQKPNKQTQWRELWMVMTVLDALLGLFVIAIAAVWRHEVDHLRIETSDVFCVPCDKIRVHVNDDWINRKRFAVKKESNTEICCTDSEKHLDELVELFVDRRYRSNRAAAPLINTCVGKVYKKDEEPKARITGIANAIKIKDKESYLLNFDRLSPNSFVDSQLEYSDGRFTIKKDAYYYIYSQVTFNDVILDEKDNRFVQHFIYRQRKYSSSIVSLIASTEELCSPLGDTTNSTSHIGGVAYLHLGDEIGVRMREPHRLAGNPYSNFFGLHAI